MPVGQSVLSTEAERVLQFLVELERCKAYA